LLTWIKVSVDGRGGGNEHRENNASVEMVENDRGRRKEQPIHLEQEEKNKHVEKRKRADALDKQEEEPRQVLLRGDENTRHPTLVQRRYRVRTEQQSATFQAFVSSGEHAP